MEEASVCAAVEEDLEARMDFNFASRDMTCDRSACSLGEALLLFIFFSKILSKRIQSTEFPNVVEIY